MDLDSGGFILATPVEVSLFDRGLGPEAEPIILASDDEPLGTVDLPASLDVTRSMRLSNGTLELEEVVPEPVSPVAASIPPRLQSESDREPGEVTPLARIALVRRTVAPDTEPVVPPTAIPLKAPSEPPASLGPIVGIDLGTATTAMAAIVDDQPTLIPSRRGTLVIPSVVVIETSGRTFVGEAAVRKLPWCPKQGIAGPGRLLGRVAGGPAVTACAPQTPCELTVAEQGGVSANFGGHQVSVEEIVALILKETRASVSHALKEPVRRAVLTCPTFFGPRQRQALRMAGELAGFHVERIVSSPLAVAAELDRGDYVPARIMVVDCGAGALDVGLVEVTSKGYELVAARGAPELGGDAYDEILVSQIATATGDLEGAGGLGGFFDIREAAELGKWTLTEQETARIEVEHTGDGSEDDEPWTLFAELYRRDAEMLFDPLVRRSIDLCRQVCEDAGWPLQSIDSVVPVGGQSRIPLLRKYLREVFGDAVTIVRPQEQVPYGAARIARRIAQRQPYRLGELIPNSISIGVSKGRLQTLLRRGEPLPALAVRTLRIDLKPERTQEVFLFEGEGSHVLDAEPLMRVSVAGLPSHVPLPTTVLLSIEMSDEGILRFEAIEQSTGRPVDVRISLDVRVSAIRNYFDIGERPPPPKDRSVFGWLLRRLSGPIRPSQKPKPAASEYFSVLPH
ncbi:MAG: Hsp70 family protein, partial [Myxococcota bacterium]